MVALNEELSGIAGEPQARSGCGAAEGAMTFPPKNQSNPRSVPYCSDSYLLDSDSSRHYARSRNYSPSIGRFTSQDPLQFINGANTYQFVMSNPVGKVDPWGLWHWYNPWTWNWSWLPWVPKVVVDTAKQVPPGGEFCGAVEALGNLPKAGGLANFREEYDYSHNINPDTDPLYTGLRKLSEGLPLTIQEHNAIANEMK